MKTCCLPLSLIDENMLLGVNRSLINEKNILGETIPKPTRSRLRGSVGRWANPHGHPPTENPLPHRGKATDPLRRTAGFSAAAGVCKRAVGTRNPPEPERERDRGAKQQKRNLHHTGSPMGREAPQGFLFFLFFFGGLPPAPSPPQARPARAGGRPALPRCAKREKGGGGE